MLAIEQLRRAVLRSADAPHARVAYQELFRAASDSDLDRLENDTDAGLALQSAWARRWLYPPEPSRVLNQAFARRFLKLFEKRLTKPPGWWEASLLNGLVHDDTRMFFSARTSSPQHRTGVDLLASADVDAEPLPEGGVLLKIGTRAVRISSQPWNEALDKARRSGGADQLSAIIEARACFLAVYAGSSCNYYVSRIDSDKGSLAWRAESWAAGCPRVGGQTYHAVELQADARSVFGFGAAPHALYAEAFDKDSGHAKLRFCTSLWSD